MLRLADLFESICGVRPDWANQVLIPEATIDSRQVIPGCLFIALPGQTVDGHDFVDQAFERGANLALVQRNLSDQYSTVDVRRGCVDDIHESRSLPLCI